jgi:hypothetical protein
MISNFTAGGARRLPFAPLPLALAAASVLSACGGGSGDDAAQRAAAESVPARTQTTSPAPEPSYTMPAGSYRLVSAATGQCVDVADGGTLQPANCNRRTTQRVQVSEESAGVAALDIGAASSTHYRVQHAGGDRFTLVDASSGQCATASGASIKPAACDASSVQQFLFVPQAAHAAAVVAAGTYQVSAVSSGLCLDIAGASAANGAKVQQQACNGAASQHFELRADTGGSWRLVDVASGKSLDVTDMSTANGAKLQQWTTAGTDNQRFTITSSGSGVAIKGVGSGRCLDITDKSTAAGAALQQWDCAGSTNQQFKLTPVGSPPPAPVPPPPPAPVPPPPSPAPAPAPSSADLFDAKKKEIAMELVSSAENSSLDWRAQYTYIEDIGDGRGYTGGIIGFCSGTGDMLEVVQDYANREPGNGLASYLPALKKVNGTASHTGLGTPYVTAWHKAASDTVFQAAQDAERDSVYFNPAVNQAKADGLRALGQFAYYDAIVMHGPGDDGTSFGGIRKAAMKKAKTPAQGGDETTYLNAFLDARVAAMKTEEAHSDTSRVDTEQRVFLKAGNLDLNTPLTWKTYGDSYSIK